LSAERDDIVQVALLRVVKTATAREGNEPMAASYIWKAAFSATIDEIRRRDRRPESPLDDDSAVMIQAAAGASPESSAAGRQLGAAIRACLERLPAERRRSVVLFLLGHTVRDVADRFGWDLKRADNLIYRGMAALRTCLAAKGLHP
jgi:RNA polymerase sigma-70 factor (ECF subfamily)